MCTGNQDCGDCFDTGFITLPTGDTGLQGPIGIPGVDGIDGTNGIDGGYINASSIADNGLFSGNNTTITLATVPVVLVNDLDRLRLKILYENNIPPVSQGLGLNFELFGTNGTYLHLHATPQNYGNSYFKFPFDSEQAVIEIELVRVSNTEIISTIKCSICSSGVADDIISYNAYSLATGFDLDINSYSVRLSSFFPSAATIKIVGIFTDKILAN